MISEDRLEKAMTYLAHTDEEAAKAKALCKKLEKMERIIRGEAFLRAAGTVAEREAKSVTSQQFRDHVCLLYTSPSPRDRQKSRMPSSA